jgi:diguanylate cyclase (GGDEF)-like protein
MLTQREDCSAEELGEVLKSDPASTGRLLRRANGDRSPQHPMYATVESAASRLGMHVVRDVALDLTLLSPHGSGRCIGFDYGRHWSMSLVRAIAARSICARMGFGNPSEAYVLGLLAQIGCLVLASVHPEEYAEVLAARWKSSSVEQCRAERGKFDIDHVEIAAYLMEEWGLPPMLGQALQCFETAENGTAEGNRDASGYANVLIGADALAEIYVSRQSIDPDTTAHHEEIMERMRKRLDLDARAFHDFCNRIGDEWFERGHLVDLAPRARTDIIRFGGEVSHPAATHRSAAQVATGPRVDGAAPPGARAAVGSGPAGRSGALSILAADDDPVSLKLLERTLLKAGHHVLCASDGRQALEIALEDNPQVVIADWMMPNMDGIELCKALRRVECGRDMFFILLTGRAEEDRVVEAFDSGIDDYVVKPFNSKVLMARIKGGHRVIELKTKVEHDRQLIMKQVAELGQLARRLDTAAHTDVLTELPNRRYIMQQLEREWIAAVLADKPLSVIIIDIDHFKKVNDVHGHDIGDLVLKETAHVLRNASRHGEELGRWGGEEFLIVCSGATEEQATAGAERLRLAVEANEIRTPSYAGRMTISLGVAGRRAGMPGIDAFLRAADEAVYQAKHAGRNCVVTAGRSIDRESKSA